MGNWYCAVVQRCEGLWFITRMARGRRFSAPHPAIIADGFAAWLKDRRSSSKVKKGRRAPSCNVKVIA